MACLFGLAKAVPTESQQAGWTLAYGRVAAGKQRVAVVAPSKIVETKAAQRANVMLV